MNNTLFKRLITIHAVSVLLMVFVIVSVLAVKQYYNGRAELKQSTRFAARFVQMASVDPVVRTLAYDRLHKLVKNIYFSNPHISYIVVHDALGDQVASFGNMQQSQISQQELKQVLEQTYKAEDSLRYFRKDNNLPELVIPLTIKGNQLGAARLGISDSYIWGKTFNAILVILGLSLLTLVTAVWFYYFYVSRKVVSPLEEMVEVMEDYPNRPKEESLQRIKDIEKQRSAAEIEIMCRSFSDLMYIISEHEQKLRESRERLDLSLKSAGLGIWDWRIDTGDLIYDARWAEMIGYAKKELEPSFDTWKSLVHPEDQEWVTRELDKHLRGESSVYRTEHRLKHKSGQWIWVLDTGKVFAWAEAGNPIRAVGIHQDITRRKKAEFALRESEIRYRTLFERAGDAIFILSERIFTDCNSLTGEMFGGECGDVLGMAPYDLSPPHQPEGEDSYSLSLAYINKALAGEPQRFYWKHRRVDGSLFDAEVTLNPVELDNKIVLLSIVRDISKQKEVEQQLISAKEQAEESDRLKSAFLANISHEIRTPLNGILGFADILRESEGMTSDQYKYADIIRQSGENLVAIIDDLLDVAKIEAGRVSVQVQLVDIANIIQGQESFFSREAEKKNLQIKVSVDLTEQSRRIYTDEIKLNQILNNLVKNALKFTREGEIIIGALEQRGEVLIYVQDTGVGIEPNKLEKIFDRFVQGESNYSRSHEGSGLGLSIAKAYVQKLDGRIWVESEPGKGSTFFFTLPWQGRLPEGEKEPALRNQISQSPQQKDSKKWPAILIAEDDENSYLVLANFLSNYAHRLFHAQNGREALDLLSQHPEIEVVFLDMRMPVLDGWSTAQEIRKSRSDIILIAQSAYSQERDKEKALAMGCDDYLAKPISQKQLSQVMGQFQN